jgi:translation initiation factor 4G
MTSAIPSISQPSHSAQPSTDAASGTTTPLSGAVPAQLPGRSYASATKTATTTPSPAGVSAPTQNAKLPTESPVNGANSMAQGAPQAAPTVPNGTPTHTEHGRKPSVVINASGASGYTPNGGPVGQSGSRPPISFGSMTSSGSPLPPASVPYQSQTSSLPAPPRDPRVISPAHSPSPIPQPPASGGRPPTSGLQGQSNGMLFGEMRNESEQVSWSWISMSHDQADLDFRCANHKCHKAHLGPASKCTSGGNLRSPFLATWVIQT